MSLFWKIYIGIFVSFLVVFSSISYLVSRKQISDAQSHLIEENRILARFLSKEIEIEHLKARWPFDSLKQLSEHRDFLFWWLVRDDGVIHLSNDVSFMGTYAYSYYPQIAKITGNEDVIFERKQNLGIFIRPVSIEKKNWLFCLGFSLKKIATLKKDIVLLHLGFSTLGAAILGILLYLTVAYFTGPINVLSKGAAIIGKGNLAHRVKVTSSDELGVLANTFNKMTEDLQKIAVSRDELIKEIAERKKVEEELKGTKKQLEFILGATKTGLDIIDSEFNLRYIDTEWQKVYGDPTGRKCYEYFMGRDEVCPGCGIVRALEIKKPVITEQTLTREGNRQIQVTTIPFQNVEGKWLFAEINVDITERKKAEEMLRENEKLLGQAQELARLGSWKFTPVTGKTVWSKEMFRIYGLESANEAPPFEVLMKMVHEEDRQAWREAIEKAKYTGGFYNLEYRIIRADGQCRWLLSQESSQPESKDETLVFYGTILDITERKKAEVELIEAHERLKEIQEQLIQAEKLEAIGRLASGVAHEVRNPLGVILQSVNYLEEKIPSEQKETLELIKDNVERADNIISALVDFSKVTKLNLAAEDINPVLENGLILIQHRVRLENIELIKELEAGLPKVLIDRMRMEQVFVNILINAVEAMPQGGKLSLRTYQKQLDKIGFRVGRRKNDGDCFESGETAVAVEIEDTGKGISEDNLKEIFEPFFTTKVPERGTGLGLSVTKNIIDMHKGLIDIKSKVGKGTRVIVTLKIAKEAHNG